MFISPRKKIKSLFHHQNNLNNILLSLLAAMLHKTIRTKHNQEDKW